MAQHNISDYKALISYHIAKARDILTSVNANKTALYWSNEDTFYMRYKPNDILVYWGLASNITTLKETYPENKFVMAPGDYYYLDCGLGNKYGAYSWCDPFKTWW